MLLAASVQSRKLGAYGDGGSRYRILDVGSWAGDIGGDGLKVVFNPSVVRLVGCLTVVSPMLARLNRSSLDAVVMCVMGVDTVIVLVRASEAGLGRRAWARVLDGGLDRGVVAVMGLTRRIVPRRRGIIRVPCAVAQVGAVCAAVVDQVVQFCCKRLVTDRVVVLHGQCYQSLGCRPGWCRAPMERYTKDIPGTQTPL